MSAANNTRLIVTKAVLWLLVGIASAVAVARYARGLGATTALTDANPWGLWIGFDVLSGVALAGGGFVIAATVYIFHLERYHALVRPAVLTAFLGYVAVALGLMVDLGRPWNIWRPIFFWQPDSPLFEVAWCVMLYLAVLALEFLPVVFEGIKWQRAYRFMRRTTLALVIAGIGLSTLHQSSLGTLFLLAKDRMHPLWYSPMQPLLFFVSAVGLGLVMVTTESCVSSWLFRRRGEWPLLRGLTRAASIVIGLYLVLRLGDLAVRGQLHHLLDPSWITVLFVVEIAVSALIPILLFTLPTVRGQTWAVTTGAMFGVAGFVLHRADVGGIAHIPITGQPYLPAITEIVISLGLVAGMALIFLFFVERFPVWEEPPAIPDHFTPPIPDPVSRSYFGGYWFSRAHLAAASWIVGVVVGVALLELTTAGGSQPRPEPIRAARATAAQRVADPLDWGTHLELVREPSGGQGLPAGFTTALLIDGDRGGEQVLFDHKDHQRRLGGESSCGRCHHLNFRLERGTPCSACHRDMYLDTDIFGHDLHVRSLKGNLSCARCHTDASKPKTRTAAAACLECHAAEVGASADTATAPFNSDPLSESIRWLKPPAALAGSARPVADGTVGPSSGLAPGYRQSLHRLCIGCHFAHETETHVDEPYLTRCASCHRDRSDAAQIQAAGGSVVTVTASLETR